MTGGLTEPMIYDLTRQSLWVAVVISAPVLTVALVVGVVIGLFQALTSVQEMTLTFVPKAAAIIAVFWLSMGFMTTSLVAFFTDSLVPLISGD
ncbi:flagellar biosynthetic protein FliQ [Tabrizicola flagellatus]|jgi:flagellar biosynthetic protein FliQ|uniref:flagellar biosynthetic protein FliQ n=1 Tax=Tabrizicola flagellatus TaxID=2593021 RepID=UPI003F49C2B7